MLIRGWAVADEKSKQGIEDRSLGLNMQKNELVAHGRSILLKVVSSYHMQPFREDGAFRVREAAHVWRGSELISASSIPSCLHITAQHFVFRIFFIPALPPSKCFRTLLPS